MASYIFTGGSFLPLAGNKVVNNGNLLTMKDSDKIIVGGEAYSLGQVNDFVFPEIYDASYYLIGKYGYSNNAATRFANPGYSEVLHSANSMIALLNGKVVDSVYNINPEIQDLPIATIMGYPFCVTSDGGIYYRKDGYSSEIYETGKEIEQIYHYESVSNLYFRTKNNELYCLYYEIWEDPNSALSGFQYKVIFSGLTQLASNCTYLSPFKMPRFMRSDNYGDYIIFFIAHSKLYYISNTQVQLYDDSGLWTWVNHITPYQENDDCIYGYGICDGHLMKMDGNYPTVLDDRTEWTMVSEYAINRVSTAGNTILYGICSGNLYQIHNNTAILISDSGDWVKVWGAYFDATYKEQCAIAGKRNGHLYHIHDRKITDLGHVING